MLDVLDVLDMLCMFDKQSSFIRRFHMPKGPQGESRPGNVVGCAVHVAKIATGEIEDTTKKRVPSRAAGGKIGGKARAKALSPERRKEIAQVAAISRWEK